MSIHWRSAGVLVASLPISTFAQWVAQGPGVTQGGQIEGSGSISAQLKPVAGAIQSVIAHPTDANKLWVFTSNGGVWRTTNATAVAPTWTPLTDDQGSLGGRSLEFDPTDGTNNTIWAGGGQRSSFGLNGFRTGLLKSTNAGTTWTPVTAAGTVVGKDIAGIAARGSTITYATDFSDANTYATVGVFRSIDGGTSFSQISSSGAGLPGGRAFELANDPTSSTTLYTAVTFAAASPGGGVNGVYRSTDTGATWSKVSSAAMDALLVDATTNNVKITVGNAGQVFVGIVNTGNLGGIFRSPTGAGAFVQLDTPQTIEGGTPIGIHPGPQVNPRPGPPPVDGSTEESGSQGATHFSLLADPTDSNIVYVAGDRQPSPFPNSLGAVDFSGRIFRVNAGLASGSQASSLTHLVGVSTTDNSSPHADSRDMVFDASGNLIEVDDGGIYQRTSPTGLGTWRPMKSVGSGLQIGEFHSAVWDARSNIIIGGTQDTGTPEQITTGGLTWRSVSTADGGQVAVDDRVALGANSLRYSSFQRFGSFRKRTMNGANAQVGGTVFPATFVPLSGATIAAIEGTMPFYTPLRVNRANGAVVVGATRVYESFDQGENFAIQLTLPAGFTVNSMDAGALAGGAADYTWVGANSSTSTAVYVRSAAGPAFVDVSGAYLAAGATSVRDISMNYNLPTHCAVGEANQVFRTINNGVSFTDITGNLGTFIDPSFAVISVRSLATAAIGSNEIIFVGLRSGDVFYTTTLNMAVWTKLLDLPNAIVLDLDYDPADDILVAGTLGRGVWTYSNVSLLVPEPTLTLLAPPVLCLRRRRM